MMIVNKDEGYKISYDYKSTYFIQAKVAAQILELLNARRVVFTAKQAVILDNKEVIFLEIEELQKDEDEEMSDDLSEIMRLTLNDAKLKKDH
ncbi:hypothetical protein B857_03977 [Solibacillus isronensis B3W22]|uniref:Uncharacterized protein n=2 Tax=Solibacillus isronensis TaxID=412383 RepID=K1KGR4_9BACL|nr:hypothetical protein B857_03977 [Solibacillus isronensis B3W22]